MRPRHTNFRGDLRTGLVDLYSYVDIRHVPGIFRMGRRVDSTDLSSPKNRFLYWLRIAIRN